jgi:hypothetical protein
MKSAGNVGRIVGVLVLIHMATGLTIPYALLDPLTAPPASFLANAAGIAVQVRLSVVLLLVGGAATIAIAVAAWPVFRQRSGATGLWLLALGVVNLALQVVENQHWLAMLFLSQEYTRAGSADPGFLQSMGAVVRSSWEWAHYTHLLVVVGWMFLLYSLLFRLAMVPPALSATGLVTCVLQLGGTTLPVLLDYRVPLSMEFYALPLGLAYLGLALWLMLKGFKVGQDTKEPLPNG